LANVPSATKRNRQRLKRRTRNLQHLVTMRTKVKRARHTLTDVKVDAAATAESVEVAIRQIARAATKGVIHKRTASRKISRLTIAANKAAKDHKAPSTATPKKQPKARPGAKAAQAKAVAAAAPAPKTSAKPKAAAADSKAAKPAKAPAKK
jgi:small subunit ribosomal protein S20